MILFGRYARQRVFLYLRINPMVWTTHQFKEVLNNRYYALRSYWIMFLVIRCCYEINPVPFIFSTLMLIKSFRHSSLVDILVYLPLPSIFQLFGFTQGNSCRCTKSLHMYCVMNTIICLFRKGEQVHGQKKTRNWRGSTRTTVYQSTYPQNSIY